MRNAWLWTPAFLALSACYVTDWENPNDPSDAGRQEAPRSDASTQDPPSDDPASDAGSSDGPSTKPDASTSAGPCTSTWQGDAGPGRIRVCVTHVIDGDTFVFNAPPGVDTAPDGKPLGRRLRFLGINAPEISHDGGQSEPFGDEATAYVRSQVEGMLVVIGLDLTHCGALGGCHDKYDRLLGYVELEDFVLNEELLRRGLARAYPVNKFPHRDSRKYVAIEKQAKEAKVGLWGSR